jgi:hypothetical protein
MVVTYGCCGNETYFGAFEQGGIAFGPGPDYQRVGILHRRGTDVPSGNVYHFAIWLKNPFEKGYVGITDNFHL